MTKKRTVRRGRRANIVGGVAVSTGCGGLSGLALSGGSNAEVISSATTISSTTPMTRDGNDTVGLSATVMTNAAIKESNVVVVDPGDSPGVSVGGGSSTPSSGTPDPAVPAPVETIPAPAPTTPTPAGPTPGITDPTPTPVISPIVDTTPEPMPAIKLPIATIGDPVLQPVGNGPDTPTGPAIEIEAPCISISEEEVMEKEMKVVDPDTELGMGGLGRLIDSMAGTIGPMPSIMPVVGEPAVLPVDDIPSGNSDGETDETQERTGSKTKKWLVLIAVAVGLWFLFKRK